MEPRATSGGAVEPFSEKGFYLAEFRGRTIAVAARSEDLRSPSALEPVLKELAANATRVIVFAADAAALASLPDTPLLSADTPGLDGAIWRALRSAGRVGVHVSGADSPTAAAGHIALRLGVSKLVWIDAAGALLDPTGRRHSFVDLAELREMLARDSLGPEEGRRESLREIEALLVAGLPALNVCSLTGLADELFTYAGSGTLFSRERYVVVRRLSIDDFDAADDLIARGVAEGYLAPRPPAAVEGVLAQAYGAFVEGRHLAGIAALLVLGGSGVAEIASLYTLTRFAGEGVGRDLVAHLVARARQVGCSAVIAVTTSERAAGFFERNGFVRVGADEVPAEKWRDYDPARRARALCLLRRF